MTQNRIDHTQTTRVIDTAVGILVGWRRCSTQSAFRELLSASERQQVPLFVIAGALVKLAGRQANAQAAGAAAQREWGEELQAESESAAQQHVMDRWL